MKTDHVPKSKIKVTVKTLSKYDDTRKLANILVENKNLYLKKCRTISLVDTCTKWTHAQREIYKK